MSKATSTQYDPDYMVHPGAILEETLEARGMKKITFSRLVGLSDKTISQIISGIAPITASSAIQFERVLGVSAALWNSLESRYRLHEAIALMKKDHQQHVKWAKSFPISELIGRGIIDKHTDDVDLVENMLNFFGVGAVELWNKRFKEISVLYRQSPSFKSAPEVVICWLRIGELIAENIMTKPYDRTGFINVLREIRNNTAQGAKFINEKMVDLCKDVGVTLIFVPEFKKTHLSGASRWLNPTKSLIMLSLRHKIDDHFWFSFFHEAGHLLKHSKKKMYISDESRSNTMEEKEADEFASNFLIPENEYKLFFSMKSFSESDIIRFASRINIAPGIVVGRLQHDNKILFNYHNRLKRKLKIVI